MCSAGFVTRPPRTTRTKTQFAGKGKPVPRAQIKDEKTYQKLRERGESKEKSARIANAAAGSSRRKVAAKGGKSGAYQDMSKADLMKRARQIGIKGRSSMSKSQLISALRNH
jgi:hypothetical protein